MGFSATRQRTEEDSYRVSFDGTLDHTSAAPLKRLLFELIDAGAERVSIDLSSTSTVDETAVGVLILAEKALRRKGGRLLVLGPGAQALDDLLDVPNGNGNGHRDR